jgi:GNAT superfamily N-acetyltransferase
MTSPEGSADLMTGTTTAAAIRRATRLDVEPTTQVLADAFQDGPVADWLVSDERARRWVAFNYFSILVDHALRHGFIDITGDVSGVAVWYPRTGNPLPEPAAYALRLADASGPWLDRFIMLDDALALRQPDRPHHHLAFLAVAPGHQGHGIGTVLLQHHHRRLAAEGVPAYAVASSPRNRDLYVRHGFRTAGPFRLPDHGPPLWPMQYDPTTHD